MLVGQGEGEVIRPGSHSYWQVQILVQADLPQVFLLYL